MFVCVQNGKIPLLYIPTGPPCCPPLGSIWGYGLPLKSEGVEATSNTQWPWTANNGHTHILLWFGPVLRSPFSSSCGPPLMDCFPHSRCLACAVASQDSRRPLGTALFSLSLTLNLQTVSNSTHYPSYPYSVACYFSDTGRRAGWILLLLLLPDNKEKLS